MGVNIPEYSKRKKVRTGCVRGQTSRSGRRPWPRLPPLSYICSITWPSVTSSSIPGLFSSKAVPETGTECLPDPLPSGYQALVFPKRENWVAEKHGSQCGMRGVVWKDPAIRTGPALPKHWTFTLNSAWKKVLMEAIL